MRGTPTKGRRFGGDAEAQAAIISNLAASMIAAEGITTTVAKAKAIRPVIEKMVTKAKKGGLENQRQIIGFLRGNKESKELANKLFQEIAPRYEDRNGGYTRILKLGPRQGDSAPMARIEFV